MRIEPRPRTAHLTGVEEDRVRRTADHRVERRIGKHDHRRLAAELERDTLDGVARGLVDDLPDLCRPRERDLVDARMRDERGADVLAKAGQDIYHARRETRLEDQLAEPQ